MPIPFLKLIRKPKEAHAIPSKRVNRTSGSGWMNMDSISPVNSTTKQRAIITESESSQQERASGSGSRSTNISGTGAADMEDDTGRGLERIQSEGDPGYDQVAGIRYRVYKRRWFGLAQLVLLNIVVSWDWLSFSAVSTTSAAYFSVSETAINWLSTSFLFAFCAISPIVIYILNRKGPKGAILIASVFLLIGNWVRYAGTRANANFGVVMFGQILSGLAQPFVLAAPTRYSDLWFTDRGRVAATAVASLANPFGGALGQLIGPFWATKPSEIPNLVLYVAIIASVATVPSFFIPAAPPLPPCASASHKKLPLRLTIRKLATSIPFWLLFIPFAIYVGFFNAFSSLINQFLEPYGFSETDAGICGALLIVVGLLTSAVTSPLVDRKKWFLPTIKITVPIIGVMYVIFVFAPPSKSLVFAAVVCAFLGASSFSLLPIALEFVVEVTHPVSPEVTSVVLWTGGQISGAIFILVMGALRNENGKPAGNLQRALIFEAVIAVVIVPVPLLLGVWGGRVTRGREDEDRGVVGGVGGDNTVVVGVPDNAGPERFRD